MISPVNEFTRQNETEAWIIDESEIIFSRAPCCPCKVMNRNIAKAVIIFLFILA
jgi:hypothetical protein